SAIREVSKVFGLSEDAIGALSSSIWGGGGGAVSKDAVTRTGLDPHSRRMRQILALAREINSFPRHLSQHVGGFVITRSRLDEVMPIGNAAMDGRTFVEWDKDDLDALGILKIDVLGLGMLPCLKLKNFYDLVIEVAIVRPGPIQGDMVHPYLRRRRGQEQVTYPSKALEAVLHKTLGVPLFQEQAMKIAIVAAGFTPSEADRLRRAMATFKRVGTIGTF